MILCRRLRFTCQAEGAEITFSIESIVPEIDDAKSGPIAGRRVVLFMALGNLLTNAMEASPPGGNVRIEVNTGRDCMVTIINQGCVPIQIRDSFFDKYVTYADARNGLAL